ncbi:MAG: DsrE family protein [Gallionellaceae bacterium]|jgi:intracellular sulfur oxidation DsrE/DsrF family protein
MHALEKKIFLHILIIVLSLPCFALAANSDVKNSTQYPIITIEKRQDIRVVYEAKDDDWDAGVGKALYYVRGLLESYKSMGVTPDKLHISIVLHGPTVYWLLNESAYRLREDDPFSYNPNEKIVQELLAHGVSVEACNATMKAKGWSGKDLLPGVSIVHDAYTRVIDLQMRHYAYIHF